MLVVTADGCGDASDAAAIPARLAAAAPNLDIRLVKRDENPALERSTHGRELLDVIDVAA